MKNKKGLLPLVFLIPLILVGLIIFYFVLKGIIGLVLNALIWTLGIAFIVLAGFIIYHIIKWAWSKR